MVLIISKSQNFRKILTIKRPDRRATSKLFFSVATLSVRIYIQMFLLMNDWTVFTGYSYNKNVISFIFKNLIEQRF